MPIFEVTPSDIERLSDTDLRTLVGYLAEQELRAKTLPTSAVTYGGHQNAKDGGIDVRVDLDAEPITGFVPRSKTGFQVKAEDMPRNAILAEMRPGDKLRDTIVELGENDGAYIIVSSKGSVADIALRNRREAMAEAIADVPNAKSLLVDFYDRRRIATWVNEHPGLIPWVKTAIGSSFAGWRPFSDWSSSPGSTDEAYILDDQIRLLGIPIASPDGLNAVDGINRVRETLAKPKGVVRLVGLSGVGKTRFVQALFDPNIGSGALSQHLAVYTDLSESPNPLPLELLGRLLDLKQRCVLIVDNCGLDLHSRLSVRAREGASLVSVITVEYDITDDEPEGTDVFKLEPASAGVTEKIIQRKFPALSPPEVSTIASFSEGNSRVAIALANTARAGESLANLRDSELFKRLFRQNNADDPSLLRAAKACSLVYSFDIETSQGNEAELPVLASLAGQTVAEFRGHMAELQRRDLLQKRSKWRAFLPHALAHRLAKQALQDMSPNVVRDTFTNQAPERLTKSFSRRLGFLHDSPEAQIIVANWLSPGGWLSDAGNLNEFGLTIFENISPVDQENTLTAIERAIPILKAEDERSELRRKMTHLLRSLAYDTQLFDRSVWVLTRLVESTDTSNNSDDATNIFASLFQIYLSGTQASPQVRAALLRRLASSNEERERALSLLGLRAMLRSGHFASSYGFEFGARKRDFGLHPRNQAEFLDWYKIGLSLGLELDKLSAFKGQVRMVLARKFPDLARCEGLLPTLCATANSFSEDGGWPEGWVGVVRALANAKSASRESDVETLTPLAEALRPRTLSERITSYVLPEQWSPLDVADIDLDDDERFKKAREAADAVCADIGRELASDPIALTEHLPALLQSRSQSVWTVALTLAQEVRSPEETWENVVPAFLSAIEKGHETDFLTPYVLGTSLRDREISERLLDDTLANPALHPYFVRIQAVAGVNEQGLRRLLSAASLVTVPIWTFANLQAGRACDALNGKQLSELLHAICAREDGTGPALDIMGMRIFGVRSDKRTIDSDDQAAGRDLLSRISFEKRLNTDGHHLASIIGACLIVPTDANLAEALCSRLLASIKKRLASAIDYGEVIKALAASFPRVVLDILVENNSGDEHIRRDIFQRFREHRPCPLDRISDSTLMEWAKERPETRFVHLAEVIRPWRKVDGTPNDDEPGNLKWSSIALLLLNEAPDPKVILDSFYKRFHPSGWSGSLADILQSRVTLVDQLKGHPDPRVSEWTTSAAASLLREIARWREMEARDRRSTDERFEH